MKKTNLLSLFIFAICFSIQSKAEIIKSYSILNITNIKQEEIPVKAYVQTQSGWIEGYVFFVNGFITRCQFPDRNGYRADIYQKTRPSALNPNNPMAVQNNFTHFIDIPNFGRAYFSI